MQKLLLTISFFCFLTRTNAQPGLPTIKATSEKVSIRVGSDYFSKFGWTLDPSKHPDIFSIGSKWHYTSKKVTFITDVDSISFDVQPGRKYDFIILKENVAYPIQILTIKDPFFLNTGSLVSLLLGFSTLLFLLYYNRKRIDARQLLLFGYWVVILFWVMTFISGYVHGNYNHLKNTISELGAIGTKSEFFTSSSLMLLAALNIVFCMGFYKASRTRRISLLPSILSFAMPVSMIWAGIFTMGNEFHGATGWVPLLIIIGSILSYFLWKRKSYLYQLRQTSLIAFMIMLLILTRFIRPFGYEFEGLVQRFFYLGWSMWTISVTYFLRRV